MEDQPQHRSASRQDHTTATSREYAEERECATRHSEKRRHHRRRSRSPSRSHDRRREQGDDGDSRHRRYRDRDRDNGGSGSIRESPSRYRHDRSIAHLSPDPSAAGTCTPATTSSDRKRQRSPPHHHHLSSPASSSAVSLPSNARRLSRWDFAAYEPLFAHYLDVQKSLRIADLDDAEVRGRWKSFLGKWNRGELAAGWYGDDMFLQVVRMRALGGGRRCGGASRSRGDAEGRDDYRSASRSRGRGEGAATAGGVGLGISFGGGRRLSEPHEGGGRGQVLTPPMSGRSIPDSGVMMDEDGDEVEGGDSGREGGSDDWGPELPPPPGAEEERYDDGRGGSARQGPAIPSLQDLEVRRVTAEEERQVRLGHLRLARRADRAEQKERLDELLPRAAPGSRERMLEKKQALNDKMREFRERSPGATMEVQDGDLMGGGDGADDYRRMLASLHRRKTERDVRREEEQRARDDERDERVKEYRAREESTRERLRELARLRFGEGG